MKRIMLILLIVTMAGGIVCGLLSRQDAPQPVTGMPTPTVTPTAKPTAEPTTTPTATPTAGPTATPTATPTAEPTAMPTEMPLTDPAPGTTVTDLEAVGRALRNHNI